MGGCSVARYTQEVMTAAAKQIFEAALKLERGERERLAKALWQSIDERGDVDLAWVEEVKQRIAAADAGAIDSTRWNDARDELLDVLKQSDVDVDVAWTAEVKQRIAAADAGAIDSTPWNEARDQLLDVLKQIHSHGR